MSSLSISFAGTVAPQKHVDELNCCSNSNLHAVFSDSAISLTSPRNITKNPSATAEGFIYVFSLGVGLSGLVYGYASDTFLRFSDVFDAMSKLIARYASFFVMLFFLAQFFASVTYTRIDECLGISPELLSWLSQFCSYIPLIF